MITNRLIQYIVQTIQTTQPQELSSEPTNRLIKTIIGLLKECFLSISLRDTFISITCEVFISLNSQPDAKFLDDLTSILKLSPASKLMVALSLIQETANTGSPIYQEAVNFLIAVFRSLPPLPQKSIVVNEGPFHAYLCKFLEDNKDLSGYLHAISCPQMMAGTGAEARRQMGGGPMLLPSVPEYGQNDPAGIIYQIGPNCSANIPTFRTQVFSRLTRPLTEMDVVYMIEAIIK